MSMPKPHEMNKRLDVKEEKMSAEELKKWMNTVGMSGKEFSTILGVSEQAVTLWVTGRRDFNVTNSRLVRLFMKYPKLLKEF